MTTINSILATAASSVGDAHRDSSGIGYYAYVPYHDYQPHGATTKVRSGSRSGILAILRAHKMAIAVALAADEFGLDASMIDISYEEERLSVGYEADWRKVARQVIAGQRALQARLDAERDDE